MYADRPAIVLYASYASAPALVDTTPRAGPIQGQFDSGNSHCYLPAPMQVSYIKTSAPLAGDTHR